MHAFDAELRRLLSRRLLRILFALVVLGFIVAGIFTFASSSETVFVQEVAPGFEQRVDDRYKLVNFLDIAEELSGLFVLFFVVLGATAIGAEWTNRNLTASLTFEPRRGVLLTAKLAAVVLIAFVGAVLLEFVLLACMLPAAYLRGTTQGVDASWWADLFMTTLRAGGVAAFGATFGLAIATIGRNTAAALGVSFVYFAILESLFRVWKPEYAQWLIGDNMAIVSSGEATGFVGPEHGPGRAAAVLAIYGVGLYVLAVAFFRNRDIA
jgi:ABC-type transport system involved in multi-copper enzyme maturation permease subunit